MSRLLTEEELRKVKVRRTYEPVKKAGKIVGGVFYGLGKTVIDGLNYLGRESAKSKPQGSVPDMSIDLGFNKQQKKYKAELDSVAERARKIRRAKVKIRARRRAERRNRFA